MKTDTNINTNVLLVSDMQTFTRHVGTCAMTSCDQMSEAEEKCCPFVISDSEGLRRVGPNTVAKLWRDILLMGSFSATLQEQTSPGPCETNTLTAVLPVISVCLCG